MTARLYVNTAAVAASCALGACSYTPPSFPAPPVGGGAPASVLVVADPQIHNVYGYRLRQTSRMADAVSKVAIRPPEQNLIAPHALEHILRQGAPGNQEVVLLLGDATNVACSSEYEEFDAAMQDGSGAGTLWLAAHGNHDSYMMGTVNNWIPADSINSTWANAGWDAIDMPRSQVPTDEAWWGSGYVPDGNDGPSWNGVCYRPDSAGGGTPMNKVMWMRKYLDGLVSHGLEIPGPPLAAEVPAWPEPIDLDFYVRPGTRLASIRYRAVGEWTPPHFGDAPSRSNFTRTANSFIVQSAEFDEYSLLLIDTSVCGDVDGGFLFTKSAGSIACLGDPQLDVIEELADGLPRDKPLVVGAHHPLRNFGSSWWDRSREGGRERTRLLGILESHGADWVYLSAHTHTSKDSIGIASYNWESGVEINVGSTTDWPMVGHRLFLTGDDPSLWPRASFFASDAPELEYLPPSRRTQDFELCRHLPAAEALAELDPSTLGDTWTSPSPEADCSLQTTREWSEAADSLQGFRDTIRARFDSEPDYREAVLRIATAASKRNHDSKDLASIIGH